VCRVEVKEGRYIQGSGQGPYIHGGVVQTIST
jgi:hypothetical protein